MRIELEKIRKSFNKKTNVIENLNLTIDDGEFVALLGPSGCGKTTTMLMIAGIYKPNAGCLYFDEQVVNDVEPKDRNIGMVFQSYALYPHMTVLDNIGFPLKQQKLPKEQIIERAKEAAEMVHLGHLLERMPSQLSGGQQQRVALARAIVKKPKILLLDEPLSNLDARLKVEMRGEISRLQKELGITTVLVTHDQEEAMTMADKVAVMKEGKIIQYSTPMDLYNCPKEYFVAQFIGTPPMNFLKGTLSVDGTEAPAQLRIEQNITNVNREKLDLGKNDLVDVHVGIRPHDLKIGNFGDLCFKGTVSLVEPIGHSQMVIVKLGDDKIRFFVDPTMKVDYGSEIELTTNVNSLHIFDAASGRCILKNRANNNVDVLAEVEIQKAPVI